MHRRGSLIAHQPLLWRLELDHQPVGMDFDPEYMCGDEVSIVSGCRLLDLRCSRTARATSVSTSIAGTRRTDGASARDSFGHRASELASIFSKAESLSWPPLDWPTECKSLPGRGSTAASGTNRQTGRISSKWENRAMQICMRRSGLCRRGKDAGTTVVPTFEVSRRDPPGRDSARSTGAQSRSRQHSRGYHSCGIATEDITIAAKAPIPINSLVRLQVMLAQADVGAGHNEHRPPRVPSRSSRGCLNYSLVHPCARGAPRVSHRLS
jgi:hypothetical protein